MLCVNSSGWNNFVWNIITMKQDDLKSGHFKAVIDKSRNFFHSFLAFISLQVSSLLDGFHLLVYLLQLGVKDNEDFQSEG